jgi:hypothetical protein
MAASFVAFFTRDRAGFVSKDKVCYNGSLIDLADP